MSTTLSPATSSCCAIHFSLFFFLLGSFLFSLLLCFFITIPLPFFGFLLLRRALLSPRFRFCFPFISLLFLVSIGRWVLFHGFVGFVSFRLLLILLFNNSLLLLLLFFLTFIPISLCLLLLLVLLLVIFLLLRRRLWFQVDFHFFPNPFSHHFLPSSSHSFRLKVSAPPSSSSVLVHSLLWYHQILLLCASRRLSSLLRLSLPSLPSPPSPLLSLHR
mmetsp:Transcript_13104/g.28373  ORF Transcript_13104/g.28373 Transcript_13104/m.28373 type:complete len:217 (-) Transcript_13104:4865-5515(-)